MTATKTTAKPSILRTILSEAKLTRHDGKASLVLAWFGTRTIIAYSYEGVEVCRWFIPASDVANASVSMTKMIKEQKYHVYTDTSAGET